MIGGAFTMPANAQLRPMADRTVDLAAEERDVDDDIDVDRDADDRVRYRVS